MYVVKREKVENIESNQFFFLSISRDAYAKYESRIKELDDRVINYFLAVHREASFKNAAYMQLIKENIEKASCAIILLDDESLNNPGANQMIAYEIGLIRGLNKTLFLINHNLSKQAFALYNDSPYRQNQLSNINDIQDLVFKSSKYSKNVFSKKELNNYAYPRINFMRLVVYMDLKLSFINRLKEIYSDLDNDEILSLLEDNLNAGIKVVRFGNYNDDGYAYFWPYEEEKEEINKYYPTEDGQSIKVIASDFKTAFDETDKVATIRMEFIFPIHTILGVHFLLFFKLKGNMLIPDDIVEMLENDGYKKEEINIDGDYLYVPINCDDIHYGKGYKYNCNYIYPN